jgi:hypothetical protein
VTLRDPAIQARRIAASAAEIATPEGRAKRSAGAHRRFSDPAEREKIGAARKRMMAARPDIVTLAAKNLTDWRAKNDYDWQAHQRRLQDARRGVVPEGYWDEYQRLRKNVRLGAVEARRIVCAQAASDERQRLAALSPHERQMERVRNGAKLVEKPDFRTAAPGYTLGGVSSWML